MATDVLDLSRRHEASTSQTIADAYFPADNRDKSISEDGDESGYGVDEDGLRMMKEGRTQLEVRLEGGSKTISFPMDCVLLVDTEEVVLALNPLCCEVEGKTLRN